MNHNNNNKTSRSHAENEDANLRLTKISAAQQTLTEADSSFVVTNTERASNEHADRGKDCQTESEEGFIDRTTDDTSMAIGEFVASSTTAVPSSKIELGVSLDSSKSDRGRNASDGRREGPKASVINNNSDIRSIAAKQLNSDPGIQSVGDEKDDDDVRRRKVSIQSIESDYLFEEFRPRTRASASLLRQVLNVDLAEKTTTMVGSDSTLNRDSVQRQGDELTVSQDILQSGVAEKDSSGKKNLQVTLDNDEKSIGQKEAPQNADQSDSGTRSKRKRRNPADGPVGPSTRKRRRGVPSPTESLAASSTDQHEASGGEEPLLNDGSIAIPLECDVLVGHSKFNKDHPGNTFYRELILKHAPQYRNANCPVYRAKVIQEVLHAVTDRGGRFLQKVFGRNHWMPVSDTDASRVQGLIRSSFFNEFRVRNRSTGRKAPPLALDSKSDESAVFLTSQSRIDTFVGDGDGTANKAIQQHVIQPSAQPTIPDVDSLECNRNAGDEIEPTAIVPTVVSAKSEGTNVHSLISGTIDNDSPMDQKLVNELQASSPPNVSIAALEQRERPTEIIPTCQDEQQNKSEEHDAKQTVGIERIEEETFLVASKSESAQVTISPDKESCHPLSEYKKQTEENLEDHASPGDLMSSNLERPAGDWTNCDNTRQSEEVLTQQVPEKSGGDIRSVVTGDHVIESSRDSRTHETDQERPLVHLATEKDVLIGKSTYLKEHPGNLAYRRLVLEHLESFGKGGPLAHIVQEIIGLVRKWGGCFMEQGPGGLWTEVSDRRRLYNMVRNSFRTECRSQARESAAAAKVTRANYKGNSATPRESKLVLSNYVMLWADLCDHSGNISFHRVIVDHLLSFHSASCQRGIVDQVRREVEESGGRFVRSLLKNGETLWDEVDDESEINEYIFESFKRLTLPRSLPPSRKERACWNSQVILDRKRKYPPVRRHIVFAPTPMDVYICKGHDYKKHPGNARYLRMVYSLSPEFFAVSDSESKKAFVYRVIDAIESDGGRFLERVDDSWAVIEDYGQLEATVERLFRRRDRLRRIFATMVDVLGQNEDTASNGIQLVGPCSINSTNVSSNQSSQTPAKSTDHMISEAARGDDGSSLRRHRLSGLLNNIASAKAIDDVARPDSGYEGDGFTLNNSGASGQLGESGWKSKPTRQDSAPTDVDVVIGTDVDMKEHPGNEFFLKRVRENCQQYFYSDDKNFIIGNVVDYVKKRGGSFVEKNLGAWSRVDQPQRLANILGTILRKTYEEMSVSDAPQTEIFPSDVDVIVGRHPENQKYPGNVSFQQLLREQCFEYKKAGGGKVLVERVIHRIAARGGRFIERKGSKWELVQDFDRLENLISCGFRRHYDSLKKSPVSGKRNVTRSELDSSEANESKDDSVTLNRVSETAEVSDVKRKPEWMTTSQKQTDEMMVADAEPSCPPMVDNKSPTNIIGTDALKAIQETETLVPTKLDVLIGRDRSFARHPGNLDYKDFVYEHHALYMKAPVRRVYSEKMIHLIHQRGGRFLERADWTDSWREVTEKKRLVRLVEKAFNRLDLAKGRPSLETGDVGRQEEAALVPPTFDVFFGRRAWNKLATGNIFLLKELQKILPSNNDANALDVEVKRIVGSIIDRGGEFYESTDSCWTKIKDRKRIEQLAAQLCSEFEVSLTGQRLQRVPEEELVTMEYNDNDVVIGRDPKMREHPGNVTYSKDIVDRLDLYKVSEAKQDVVDQIISRVILRNGRFLTKSRGQLREIIHPTRLFNVISSAFRRFSLGLPYHLVPDSKFRGMQSEPDVVERYGDSDVLVGSDPAYKAHPGNAFLAKRIRETASEYQKTERKSSIYRKIEADVGDRGGRFLEIVDGQWRTIVDRLRLRSIARSAYRRLLSQARLDINANTLVTDSCTHSLDGDSMRKVDSPGDTDVIFGGRLFDSHAGNVSLKRLINDRSGEYWEKNGGGRDSVLASIVNQVKSLGGSFLRQRGKEWVVVSDEHQIHRRISQLFQMEKGKSCELIEDDCGEIFDCGEGDIDEDEEELDDDDDDEENDAFDDPSSAAIADGAGSKCSSLRIKEDAARLTSSNSTRALRSATSPTSPEGVVATAQRLTSQSGRERKERAAKTEALVRIAVLEIDSLRPTRKRGSSSTKLTGTTPAVQDIASSDPRHSDNSRRALNQVPMSKKPRTSPSPHTALATKNAPVFSVQLQQLQRDALEGSKTSPTDADPFLARDLRFAELNQPDDDDITDEEDWSDCSLATTDLEAQAADALEQMALLGLGRP